MKQFQVRKKAFKRIALSLVLSVGIALGSIVSPIIGGVQMVQAAVSTINSMSYYSAADGPVISKSGVGQGSYGFVMPIFNGGANTWADVANDLTVNVKVNGNWVNIDNVSNFTYNGNWGNWNDSGFSGYWFTLTQTTYIQLVSKANGVALDYTLEFTNIPKTTITSMTATQGPNLTAGVTGSIGFTYPTFNGNTAIPYAAVSDDLKVYVKATESSEWIDINNNAASGWIYDKNFGQFTDGGGGYWFTVDKSINVKLESKSSMATLIYTITYPIPVRNSYTLTPYDATTYTADVAGSIGMPLPKIDGSAAVKSELDKFVYEIKVNGVWVELSDFSKSSFSYSGNGYNTLSDANQWGFWADYIFGVWFQPIQVNMDIRIGYPLNGVKGGVIGSNYVTYTFIGNPNAVRPDVSDLGNITIGTTDNANIDGSVLTWSDEFNGTSLDTNVWNYRTGYYINDDPATWGWGNAELEYYTDSQKNVFVKDGKLNLIAYNEPKSFPQDPSRYAQYSSGKITTQDKFTFTYGRIDFRAKLPRGNGMWPALWMLPNDDTYGTWAASGEIDVMEARGRLPGASSGTVHFGGTWPANTYIGGDYSFPGGQTIDSDYHVYSAVWEDDNIKWYVDGKCFFKATKEQWYSNGAPSDDNAPFDQDFYIIMNLAVGGWFDGGQVPNASDLPATMQVDYVRVYDAGGSVIPVQVPVTGMTLDQTQATLTSVGQTITLSKTFTPSNATNKNVTWVSSNPAVATVSAGQITAVSNGTTNITATTVDGGYTSTCVVTVNQTALTGTPTFTPAPGTYTTAQNVTISCATAGATIKYTTDGSTPTANSATYTAPIPVTATTTIKAYALKSGMTDSAVATGAYTINLPTGIAIPGKIEAENYTAMSGIQTEATGDTGGGMNVGYTDTGDYMDYNVNVATAGTYNVDFRVASPSATGQVQLRSGANTLCTANVPNTTGWQTWQTVRTTANLTAGNQVLRVYVSGGGFNLNSIDLSSVSTPVATPTITPAPGTYTTAQNVTISCATAGATIKYTTDGSTPTASSATYTAAINVAATTTIKAIATKTGMTNSSVATAAYTISSNLVNLALNKTGIASSGTPGPAFDGNTGTRWESNSSDPQWIYVDLGANNTVSGVKLNWETASGKTYKIQTSTDAVTWTDVYTQPNGAGGIENLAFTPVTARYVRMYGTVRNTIYGYSLWELEVYGQTEPQSQVATPTFTPAAGTYTSAQSVTLASATAGATIKYTTDGSTPTAASATYTAAINVAATTTIKAIATKTGMTDSAVASGAYTINIPTGIAIPGKIEAENYTAMSGIQTEATGDTGGGMNVGYTDTGDYMDYNVNVATAGTYNVDFRVASSSATGQVQLRSGANTLCTANVPNTTGWQIWQTVSSTVNLSAGNQVLRVYVSGGGFNLNSINFSSVAVPVATPTFTPAPGTYTTAQNVTITCATAGATIKYTTDGSTPTASSATYTAPINVAATTTIKAIATKTGMTDSSVATAAYTISSTSVNLALNKLGTASSGTPGLAFDGNAGTRWESASSDPQWIYVDLGANNTVSGVKLNWETASGKTYKIQTSTDAVTWTDVYTQPNGAGGIENLAFTPVTARYVRMYGTVRNTIWGYSLWEFEVYR